MKKITYRDLSIPKKICLLVFTGILSVAVLLFLPYSPICSIIAMLCIPLLGFQLGCVIGEMLDGHIDEHIRRRSDYNQ